jgi:hypothetical protein
LGGFVDSLPTIVEQNRQAVETAVFARRALHDELVLLRQEIAELRPLKQQVEDLRTELAGYVALADEIHDGAFSRVRSEHRRTLLRVLKGGRATAIGGGVALLIIGGIFMPRFTAIFDPAAMPAQSLPIPGATPPEITHPAHRPIRPKVSQGPGELPDVGMRLMRFRYPWYSPRPDMHVPHPRHAEMGHTTWSR